MAEWFMAQIKPKLSGNRNAAHLRDAALLGGARRLTIAYHGTPITPAAQLARMHGEHFCVSFWRPDNADVCETIGASVMWDNGAFSAYTKGAEKIDSDALYDWREPRLYHPHRAGRRHWRRCQEVQREAVARWPFSRDLSWPVGIYSLPDYLSELCDGGWAGICLGSAGEFWKLAARHGNVAWRRRSITLLGAVGCLG